MSIGSVGSSLTILLQTNPEAKRSPRAPLGSPSADELANKSTHQSVVVTLSDGAKKSDSLTATPLAVAWAPQMFVQGDSSGDRQLSKDEFETQMKRAGLATGAADKLFKTFDSSDDGQLTVSEYVDGVNDSIRAGNESFDRLMHSYIQDANGGVQKSAIDQFLKEGEEVASAYWKNAR
ncbi:hypothetical protein B0G80_4884 [Paraburkholderia sp. BL6669N2]|uniref:EF-hand domain-containing protein n=1 Tax=Paraburkholderia sp. BL6669N2 TaxID=1938807 RepID=UPI000E26E1AB|nr:EF-hand domain-containing protein [Paraburkholderia sp. BL6669N2]REG48631.1 hypothetical protein B0G80_4884 [Paraburkholderia sp. BL6669N2]